MIAYLKGALDRADGQTAVVDVGGVGYLVHISPATASRLPGAGSEVKIHTSMIAREDGVSLYGFLTPEELRLFALLNTVSGIGPKAALALLATLSPQQLAVAIVSDDAAALSKAPGIGPKTAKRAILELRDKMKSPTWGAESGSEPTDLSVFSSQEKQDALDALMTLGYGRPESLKAVLSCAQEGMTTEAIVRLALKQFAAK